MCFIYIFLIYLCIYFSWKNIHLFIYLYFSIFYLFVYLFSFLWSVPPPKAYFRFSSGRFLTSRSPDANKNVAVSPWRGTISAKDSLGTDSWAKMDEGSRPPGHPNRSGSLICIETMEVCKVTCDATITCSTGSPNPNCTRYLSTMASLLVKALGGAAAEPSEHVPWLPVERRKSYYNFQSLILV